MTPERASLVAEVQDRIKHGSVQDLDFAITRLDSYDFVVLSKLVLALQDLIQSTVGVSGLHLNGEVADWGSLLTGGQFEYWLLDFDEALEIAKIRIDGV